MPTDRDERAVDGLETSTPKGNVRVWLITFLIAFALYALTANKGPQWQDSGEQQIRMMEGRIEHMHGIALMHPVHFYLGRWAYLLLPIEAGFAITLVSAFAAAIALANLNLLLAWCNVSAVARCCAVGGLMLAHTFFEHATHTESYMLVAALLTTEWLLLAAFLRSQRWPWLVFLFFVNGLGIANHMLATLATPVYAVVFTCFLLRRDKNKVPLGSMAAIPLAWLVGLTPLLMVMYDDYQQGHDLIATLKSTAFGTYANDVVNTRVSLKGVGLAMGFCGYNFPNVLLPLVPVGLIAGRRKLPRLLYVSLLTQAAIYGLFVIRYSIVDQYSYFFVVYLFFAVFAAVGFDTVRLRLQPTLARWFGLLAAISVAITPLIYMATAATLEARGMLRGMVGNKPYRNGYQAFFVPWGAGDDHVDQLNNAIMQAVDDDGTVLFVERMTSFALCYQQIEGRLSSDVSIDVIGDGPYASEMLADIKAKLNEGSTVVLVPRDRDHPPALPGFELERTGDIYLVRSPR